MVGRPLTQRWVEHFFHLAREVSLMSKDPSTKFGVVIVDQNREVVSTGYNGFPRGIEDTEERYEDRNFKYPRVVHAEMNALLQAGRRAEGSTLFLWGAESLPCDNCMKHIIAAGVWRVLGAGPPLPERWKGSCQLSQSMANEANVQWLKADQNLLWTEASHGCSAELLCESQVRRRFRDDTRSKSDPT